MRECTALMILPCVSASIRPAFHKHAAKRRCGLKRGRCGHRADAGNLLVSNCTVGATGLDQATVQPGGCLAKADKHDRTGLTWSPTRRTRGPLRAHRSEVHRPHAAGEWLEVRGRCVPAPPGAPPGWSLRKAAFRPRALTSSRRTGRCSPSSRANLQRGRRATLAPAHYDILGEQTTRNRPKQTRRLCSHAWIVVVANRMDLDASPAKTRDARGVAGTTSVSESTPDILAPQRKEGRRGRQPNVRPRPGSPADSMQGFLA
jgi:hypothetical protein